MENTTEKEVVTNEVTETKPAEIDYEKINSTIKDNVEKEVGKFIKNFIETNNTVKPEPIEEQESEAERELKAWRI